MLKNNYYYQENASAPQQYIKGPLSLGARVADTVYSGGKNLSVNKVEQLLQSAIDANYLPLQSKGIYLFLSAPDVNVTDAQLDVAIPCSTSSTEIPMSYRSATFYLTMMGNVQNCIAGYSFFPNKNASPNGDVGIDAMIQIIAWTIQTTMTNPDNSLPSWVDDSDQDTGDKW